MKIHISYLLAAFGVTAGLGVIILEFLKSLHVGQHIRDDGPESHLKKAGTPSMGGLIFLVGITVVAGWAIFNITTGRETLILLLFATLAFGFIGFIDDYIKFKKARSLGLKAWQKMILLLIVSGAFVAFLLMDYNISIPFFDTGYELNWHVGLNLGTDTYIPIYKIFYDLNFYFFVPFAMLVLISTTNVVNITDGLDGLAGGITVIIMTFFTVLAIAFGNDAVMIFSAIVTGACLAFLIFNLNPARVFMGDTGSLALGGAIGAVSLVLQVPVLLILVAGVCVIEALSDIIQVVYFKATGGERIFKMAPLHHHLELSGWSEKKVVWTFWLLSIVFAVIAFILV